MMVAKGNHMKNDKLVRTAIPSAIAAAALLLSLCSPFKASILVAYGAAGALGVLLSLEYRLPWRRLFGRQG